MISALEKENRLIDYFVKKGIRHFTGWVEQAEKYDPREDEYIICCDMDKVPDSLPLWIEDELHVRVGSIKEYYKDGETVRRIK